MTRSVVTLVCLSIVTLAATVAFSDLTGGAGEEGVNGWVEWTEEPTTGDTCSGTSSPEDEVTHWKQWHVYFRNTCWDQSVAEFLSEGSGATTKGSTSDAETRRLTPRCTRRPRWVRERLRLKPLVSPTIRHGG